MLKGSHSDGTRGVEAIEFGSDKTVKEGRKGLSVARHRRHQSISRNGWKTPYHLRSKKANPLTSSTWSPPQPEILRLL
jgi:hypothetical protein